jgi:hypothetical protein
MKLPKYTLAAAALGLMCHGALAFEETTIGGGEQKAPAAPAVELPKAPPGTAKDLDLSGGPSLNLGKTSGTEVRIPGFGTVGVLPKLDFGLELLYGANEQKGIPQDQINPDDVQIRGTIKHRF